MPAQSVETLTIRLPRKLKSQVEKSARARGRTVTGEVVQALRAILEPAGRVYQLPGFTPVFGAFLDGAVARDTPVVVLVADERTGHRSFFEGRVDAKLTNESIVAIGGRDARRAFEPPWIIPRRDVVAWYGGDGASLNGLAMTLARQGWAARNAPWG